MTEQGARLAGAEGACPALLVSSGTVTQAPAWLRVSCCGILPLNSLRGAGLSSPPWAGAPEAPAGLAHATAARPAGERCAHNACPAVSDFLIAQKENLDFMGTCLVFKTLALFCYCNLPASHQAPRVCLCPVLGLLWLDLGIESHSLGVQGLESS